MLTTVAATTNPITTTTTTETTRRLSQQQQQRQGRRRHQRQQQLQKSPQLLLFGLTILISIIAFAPLGTYAVPLTNVEEHNIAYKRYCSTTLSDAIRLICGGRFNSLGRKFPDSFGHGAMRSLQSLVPNDDDSYFRPFTSGPIHECCRRPCGYPELKMYCAPED